MADIELIKVKVGDKIKAQGFTYIVAEILTSDEWMGYVLPTDENKKPMHDIEFRDNNGNYHHWKSWADGGEVIRTEPKQEEPIVTEKRVLFVHDLQNLCKKRDYYSKGTNAEFEHLLYDMAHNKSNITTNDIIAIAKDIQLHSKTDETLGDTCFYVASACLTIFSEN